MSRKISIFSYPVVLVEIGGEITWVCPDFALYKAVSLPEGKKIGASMATRVAYGWLQIMRLLYSEIKKKQAAGKTLPAPSTTSELFDLEIRSAKTYSPVEAAPLIGYSANTIRRALDAGVVGFVKTPGGHRRMTEHQVIELRRLLVMEPDLRGQLVGRDIQGLEDVGQS